jgi:DNA-binding LacI/PurR family transcriptional regulator
LARLVEPALTSVKLDVFNLASQGTRRLLQRIERGELKDVFQERFPVSLAVRASTQGAARAEKPA